MANPFPGMNPYLEEVELWKGVHTNLIVRCAAALNALLPDHYFADAQARVVREPIHKDYVPDVVMEQLEPVGGQQVRRAVSLVEADEPFVSI